MRYRVHFIFHVVYPVFDQPLRNSVLIPEGRGIADIREGFWLNAKGEWGPGDCTGEDAYVIWVPPAQVLYVSKEKE